MSPRPVAPQLVVLLVALALAAATGAASFAGLLAAYAAAWLALGVAYARGARMPALGPRATVLLAVVAGAAPVVSLAARATSVADAESLLGLGENVADRVRLERAPSIHPALVAGDLPQTFFVHADGARRLRVTLAPGVAPIDGEALGHGLFRVDYDPRRDRAPHASGDVQARIDVDGSVAERPLRAVLAAAHPRWLRVAPDGASACVTSEETDELIVVGSDGVRTRVVVGDGPTDCAWLPDGDIAVAHRGSRDVELVGPDGAAVATVDVGFGQAHLAVDGGGRFAVALDDGEVVVVGPAPDCELAHVHVGGIADWVAFDGAALVVTRREPAGIVRIALDGAPRIVAERALLAPAVTMTSLAAGARVAIAVTDWSDDASPHAGNHFVQDQLVELDARTLTPTRFLRTARRSPRQDAAGDVDRGVSPMGVFETRTGLWLVAFAGTDELSLLDPTRGASSSFDVAKLGLSAPFSVVALADGTLVATSPSSGRIATLDPRTGALRDTVALAPSDATLLRRDPDALQRRYGERAFYESTRAGISCQSCHLFGGSDGMSHNIGGRVLSRTLDVHGIAGTAPYLHDGSYPRIGDLLEVAEQRYRGYREPAGDRAATLDAWVSSLPLAPPRSDRDAAAERRGLDVFVHAGCPTCHAFPAFTNLGRHPVHTVFPRAHAAPGASLDTPSLRGVSRRGRFLFDARAATLESIFVTHNPDERHGHTRALSRAERTDLVRFLESL